MNVKKTGRTPEARNTGPADKGQRGQTVEQVKLAQRGDLTAFQELYESFSHKIVNYLYRMTGSRAEAEDLAQDTFVLAYRNLTSLKDPARFQSWLYRIAQNSVYQRFRSKGPELQSIDEEIEGSGAQELPALDPGPEASVLSDELETVIEKAISSLPEKYRTVFVLSAVQRLSYNEISEIVGRSLASVKSDIHRARVDVRDRVKGYLSRQNGMSELP